MIHKLIRRFKTPDPAVKQALPYPHTGLFHWQPKDGRVNFGDHLSKIIVQNLISSRGLSLDDEVRSFNTLLGIGSILHFAKDGDIIWGSGINGKMPEDSFRAKKLDIRAVRGPLTADFLKKRGHNVPEVYGDPGLLTKHLFAGRFTPTAEQDYVFVPNLHDLPLVAGQDYVVSPLQGWNKVVSDIMKAKLVLASSLHGLVIAEAFGIPARYVRLTQEEGLFKYQDYFYGTGRDDFTYATSIEQGLDMGGMKSFSYDPKPLIDAFPWELWD